MSLQLSIICHLLTAVLRPSSVTINVSERLSLLTNSSMPVYFGDLRDEIVNSI